MSSTQNNVFSVEKSPLFYAGMSGIFYLVFLIFGVTAQIIRNTLIIPENALNTVNNIKTGEFLFRLSIVSDLAGLVIFIFLVLSLYKLLHRVNKQIAQIMVILVFIGIPVGMINMLNQFAVIILLNQKGLDTDQLQTQVMFFLNLYENGYIIAEIFWGLWLIPFGYLVLKSGFLPKFLGILLIAGGFGFLIHFFIMFLFPVLKIITYPGMAISTIAEISAILWLLIRGINKSKIVF